MSAGGRTRANATTPGRRACGATTLGLVALSLAIASTADPRVARSDPASTPATIEATQTTALPPAVATTAPTVPTVPMAGRWLPSRGRQCIGRGRYKGFCQGPRRVPEPYGEAAELARSLGLGEVKAVSRLLLDPPPPRWVAAAATTPPAATVMPKLLWPVETGKLWRGYGRVRRPKARRQRHRGVDIGAAEGTPIRAVQDGLVVYANNEVHGYGNLLVTVHSDASVGLYGHCQTVYVFPGQHVTRGQHVADVGDTGIARGAHLHFEYRERGITRDPMQHFDPTTIPKR